jgi:hypothetical protein
MRKVYYGTASVRPIRGVQKVASHLCRYVYCIEIMSSLSFRSEDVLMSALKRNEVPQKDRRSSDAYFSPVEQQNVCRILNTADYCHRTATQASLR